MIAFALGDRFLANDEFEKERKSLSE